MITDGLSPIGEKPYKSTSELAMIRGDIETTALNVKAKDLGLRVFPDANVYGAPLIASHVGSDVAADLLSIGMDNEMDFGQFEFELGFTPSFVDITAVTPTERTSFDSAIVENNSVTLINPTISAGTGDILNIQLFNNVGVESNVVISYNMCLACLLYTSPSPRD